MEQRRSVIGAADSIEERKQVQFWKRESNHYTFIGNPSAGDRVFAPRTLAGWFGLTIDEVGQ